jgi:hypothetical protein
MRVTHLALLVALFVPSVACSAATGDDGDETLVGANEDEVDFAGESVAGSVAVGAQMKATDAVNIRSGASTSYRVLKVVPVGGVVTVVSGTPNGAWYNVKYAGITGWTHGAYYNRVAESAPPPSGGSTGCRSQLSALGLNWTAAGTNRGIADSIRVASPIRGVAFRYVASSSTSPILGNCAFFVKLAAAADKMKAWGVAEFTHIGTYNYRTIAGSSKLSQHALGMAIDIAGFRTTGGVYYSINNNAHFVKNTSSGTCTQARTTAGDKLFKGWACDVKAADIFNIMLTPNYNTAHRDHFHIDLTPGSDFIKANEGSLAGTPFDPNAVDPFSLEPLGDGVDLHDALPQEVLQRELQIQQEMGATIADIDG